VADDMEAAPYQVYVFDCPSCGGQTMIGDVDPSDAEDCDDCGESVRMTT